MHLKVRNLAALLILFFLFSGVKNAYSQSDTLVLDTRSTGINENIGDYCNVLLDKSQKLTIQQVQKKYFLDPKFFHDDRWQNKHRKTFWLRLTIRNNGNVDNDLYWYAGQHDYMYFYSPQLDGSYALTQTAGLMLDKSGRSKWDHFAFPLTLPALTTQTFYLKVVNKYDFENPLEPTLFDQLGWEEFKDSLIHIYQPYAYIVNIVLGMLLVLFCFMLISYRQVPDKASLYYALYVLGLALYFSLQLQSKPYQFSFLGFIPMLKYYWDSPAILICYYFIYILFTRSFLNLKETFPSLDKALHYALYVLGGIIIVDLFLIAISQFYLSRILYVSVYYLLIIPTVIVYWLLYRSRKDPLVRYFLIGSVSLFVAGLLSFHFAILDEMKIISLPPSITPQYFLIAGTVVELLFFANGLNYKVKLARIEKIKTQEALIQQLEDNRELQRRMNDELEFQVKKQTNEILLQSRELEEQRKMRLEIEYTKRLTELELRAIRAQINPHFIFNCLNSIQLFIMQHDYNSAQQYLSDFSLLIRKTLEMSKLNFVSLNDEIGYLSTYLRLEKMRFENKMEYEILIDPTVVPNKAELPSMLLQPYIENAVKHGINNPTDKGRLKVLFEEVAEDLICTIEDNGIGIRRSRELSMESFRKHLSAGMELSSNRAELINKMFNTDIKIEVTDKEEQMSGLTGTIVKIIIPQV
jgi:two-component system, LytTR family, sensor kinase